jgi:hypothetical protein
MLNIDWGELSQAAVIARMQVVQEGSDQFVVFDLETPAGLGFLTLFQSAVFYDEEGTSIQSEIVEFSLDSYDMADMFGNWLPGAHGIGRFKLPTDMWKVKMIRLKGF